MLLNEFKVLDKGSVALLSSSNGGAKLKELSDTLFGALPHDGFGDIATATLIIKCPLFLQLKLSQYNFKIIQAPQKGNVEAFIPDLTNVNAADPQDAAVIADDLKRTTEALLINPKAYQADGCDEFVSQTITPISVYTTLVIHGTLNQWIHYLASDARAPNIVKQYNTAIQNILSAEWKNFNAFKNLVKGRYGSSQG